MQGAVAPGLRPGTSTTSAARRPSIRRRSTAADEAARRADVYPGTRRDVLRKYRLDYWTR